MSVLSQRLVRWKQEPVPRDVPLARVLQSTWKVRHVSDQSMAVTGFRLVTIWKPIRTAARTPHPPTAPSPAEGWKPRIMPTPSDAGTTAHRDLGSFFAALTRRTPRWCATRQARKIRSTKRCAPRTRAAGADASPGSGRQRPPVKDLRGSEPRQLRIGFTGRCKMPSGSRGRLQVRRFLPRE